MSATKSDGLSRKKGQQLDRLFHRLAEFFMTPEGEALGVRMDLLLAQRKHGPMPELTLNEERAFGYVEQQLKQDHSPSIREVARALHFRSSRSGFRIISALIAKGILKRTQVGRLAAEK